MGFGAVGLIGTGVIFYLTNSFANHAIRKSYVTEDGKRIGFQVYNVLGNSGRLYEVPVGNTKVLPAASFMFTSIIPIQVEGRGGSFLLDANGKFYESKKLMALLNTPKDVSMAEDKRERVQFIKDSYRKMKTKK